MGCSPGGTSADIAGLGGQFAMEHYAGPNTWLANSRLGDSCVGSPGVAGEALLGICPPPRARLGTWRAGLNMHPICWNPTRLQVDHSFFPLGLWVLLVAPRRLKENRVHLPRRLHPSVLALGGFAYRRSHASISRGRSDYGY